MKYLVTATPRTTLTQEVYAASADDAIALAVANPNRWQSVAQRPGNDDCWVYGAVQLEEPATPCLDCAEGSCQQPAGHTSRLTQEAIGR